MRAASSDSTLAVFLDLENIALGARDAHYDAFDVRKVLEQLLLKGHIVVKKAYCDFERYRDFKRGLHESAFELIEIPHVRQSGKNSADIRMVVDALDLCYTKGHVDTFVIISGDSDFSPLVSKLRENAKTVIGVGVKNSTSDLFINNCDEFIYYDDLVRDQPRSRGGRGRSQRAPENIVNLPRNSSGSSGAPGAPVSSASSASSAAPPPVRPERSGRPAVLPVEKALDELMETLEALSNQRGADGPVWASMIKQTIRRRSPGFNERAFGFGSFNELLHEAARRGLLVLSSDQKSGSYTVRLAEMREEGEGGRGVGGAPQPLNRPAPGHAREENGDSHQEPPLHAEEGGDVPADVYTHEDSPFQAEAETTGRDEPADDTTGGREMPRRGRSAGGRRRRPGRVDASERESSPAGPEPATEASAPTAADDAPVPVATMDHSPAPDEPPTEADGPSPTPAAQRARARRPRRRSAAAARSTDTPPAES